MVNFAEHLKHPPKEEDPNIIRGTLTGWIKCNRTGEVTQRKCEWEIGPYAAYGGTSTTFKITKGGVTGFESFTLRDADQILHSFALKRIFVDDPEGYWSANAGGGGWDAMRIRNHELRAAIQQWLDREDIDLSKEITC
jgi:hypothetical protein